MTNQSDLEKELEQQIYGLRLLILLECDKDCEDTRHFHQVIVDDVQFKRISDAIFSVKHKEGDREIGEVNLSVRTLPLEPFEGMDEL